MGISNFSMSNSLRPEKNYNTEKFSSGSCIPLSDNFVFKDLGRESFKDLIIQYLPLIRYIASRLAMRLPANISADDLISAGVLGLMDAAEKFDPSKNIKFKTYAEFRIRGSMLDELRSMDWVPRSIRKKMTEIEEVILKLEKQKGRPAEDEEIAMELGVTIEEYHQLLDETKGVSFLDIEMIRRRMPDNFEEDLFDLIEDCEENDPFTILHLSEIKELLINTIENLPLKERQVVSLYYYEDLTMKEIGEVLGYTESRISQLHSKAILRIRSRLSRLNPAIGDMIM